MKIVFDNIIFDLQKSGGISVVWYELLSRQLQTRQSDSRFMDNPLADNYVRKLLTIRRDLIIDGNKFAALRRGLPVKLNLDEPFIFHSSYYRYCYAPKAINITTVHDFTNEFFATGLKKIMHTWQKFRTLRHSDYIVCISENTKRDLLSFLPEISEEKIRVIYNGVSDDYQPAGDALTMPLPFADKSYVIFVGSRAVYKNFRLVWQAIKETKYNLVITGPELTDQERADLDRYLPAGRYRSMGFVSNRDLNTLYNHAACLAYPSSYEGFGIPILEAQKAGCPVIAYNATSVPEVCGKSPLLMDEPSEQAFIGKLRLLDNQELMDSVRRAGLENARRFTWDAMFRSYAQLYEEIEHLYR